MVGELRGLETKGLLVLHCIFFFFFVLGGLRPSFDVNDIFLCLHPLYPHDILLS
jgi:hypothetical protein